MPKLSDSMQEGTLVRWLVGDGQAVRRGQEIAEIETDKATVAHEADVAGVLEHVAGEGDTLRVGETIARLVAPVEDPGDGEVSSAPAASDSRSAVANGGAEARRVHGSASRRLSNRQRGTGLNVSPVALRLAARLGIDVADVAGSGPRGRVLKADIAAFRDARDRSRPTAPIESSSLQRGSRREEPTRIQQVIARRMAESRATIPDFTLRAEVDMEPCAKLREDLKRALDGDDAKLPSFTDIVVKACALALTRHPRANASYRDGAFELHSRVNIGVAVASADSLVVPTVFDADLKSLGQIARETEALITRVRSGRTTPAELSGATFTVSSLGMFGVVSFEAVINPPQAAILAVGEIVRVPVIVVDEVVPRLRMQLSLTCDHRILYGADAAGFLGDIKTNLEQPLRLLIARDG